MKKKKFEEYYKKLEKHIIKYSYINGKIDEDLKQLLTLKAYKCYQLLRDDSYAL